MLSYLLCFWFINTFDDWIFGVRRSGWIIALSFLGSFSVCVIWTRSEQFANRLKMSEIELNGDEFLYLSRPSERTNELLRRMENSECGEGRNEEKRGNQSLCGKHQEMWDLLKPLVHYLVLQLEPFTSIKRKRRNRAHTRLSRLLSPDRNGFENNIFTLRPNKPKLPANPFKSPILLQLRLNVCVYALTVCLSFHFYQLKSFIASLNLLYCYYVPPLHSP